MCPNKETGYGQYNSGNYCNPKIDELTMAAQTALGAAQLVLAGESHPEREIDAVTTPTIVTPNSTRLAVRIRRTASISMAPRLAAE